MTELSSYLRPDIRILQEHLRKLESGMNDEEFKQYDMTPIVDTMDKAIDKLNKLI